MTTIKEKAIRQARGMRISEKFTYTIRERKTGEILDSGIHVVPPSRILEIATLEVENAASQGFDVYFEVNGEVLA